MLNTFTLSINLDLCSSFPDTPPLSPIENCFIAIVWVFLGVQALQAEDFESAAGAGVSGTEDGLHFLCHLF